MTRIHELLDLPEAVRKGDFVQDLTGGISNPERAVKDYAVALLERAFDYVQGRLTIRRSLRHDAHRLVDRCWCVRDRVGVGDAVAGRP